MQHLTDSQFKQVVVSILESCYGALVQDLIGESRQDISALQRFTANYAPANRVLFRIAEKYADCLTNFKDDSVDTLKLAMVCTNALYELSAVRIKASEVSPVLANRPREHHPGSAQLTRI